MKILSKKLKQGELVVLPETAEDLWLVSQVVEEGDRASASTLRKVEVGGAGETARKPMTLTITVDRIEFGEPATLRLGGMITDGPEDVPRGSYHTLAVDLNDKLTIAKDAWPTYQLKRIEGAAHQKQPLLLICAFDREEAVIAQTKPYGYAILTSLKGDVEKKREGTKARGNFWQDIIAALKEYDVRLQPERIILASPSFWKDELLKELTDKKLRDKILLATCSGADESAVHEVLQRPEAQHALKASRIAEELQLVNKVLERIQTGGAVAYGMKEVTHATNAGAVAILIITSSFISEQRKKGTYADVDGVLRMVDDAGGDVKIISASHEGGKRIDGLGGVAALLRYKIAES